MRPGLLSRYLAGGEAFCSDLGELIDRLSFGRSAVLGKTACALMAPLYRNLRTSP